MKTFSPFPWPETPTPGRTAILVCAYPVCSSFHCPGHPPHMSAPSPSCTCEEDTSQGIPPPPPPAQPTMQRTHQRALPSSSPSSTYLETPSPDHASGLLSSHSSVAHILYAKPPGRASPLICSVSCCSVPLRSRWAAAICCHLPKEKRATRWQLCNCYRHLESWCSRSSGPCEAGDFAWSWAPATDAIRSGPSLPTAMSHTPSSAGSLWSDRAEKHFVVGI